MVSREINDLHPACAALWARFDSEMHRRGIPYIVTCTFRDNAEQARLFAQGRTAPGKIVTNSRPGESAHNVTLNGKPSACAFDIVILDGGKCVWNVDAPGWIEAGKIGQLIGLDWAGNWFSFREYPHFQLTNWKVIRDGKRT